MSHHFSGNARLMRLRLQGVPFGGILNIKFSHPQQGKAQEIKKKADGNTQHDSIKKENAHPPHMNHRITGEIEYGIQADDEHSNFCGADLAVGNFVHSGYGGVYIRQNPKVQITDQRSQRISEGDNRRYAKAGQHNGLRRDIDSMIDKIAVLESFDSAVSCQRAIETIAEPIDNKAKIDDP